MQKQLSFSSFIFTLIFCCTALPLHAMDNQQLANIIGGSLICNRVPRKSSDSYTPSTGDNNETRTSTFTSRANSSDLTGLQLGTPSDLTNSPFVTSDEEEITAPSNSPRQSTQQPHQGSVKTIKQRTQTGTTTAPMDIPCTQRGNQCPGAFERHTRKICRNESQASTSYGSYSSSMSQLPECSESSDSSNSSHNQRSLSSLHKSAPQGKPLDRKTQVFLAACRLRKKGPAGPNLEVANSAFHIIRTTKK